MDSIDDLLKDIHNFNTKKEIPSELSKLLRCSKYRKMLFFRQISEEMKLSGGEKSPRETSTLIEKALVGAYTDHLETILKYYSLPSPTTGRPVGFKFEILSLPVNRKAVQDGDSLIVYVQAHDFPEDISNLSERIKNAYRTKQISMAESLQTELSNSGYRVVKVNRDNVLATKYRLRLRGIDAPESGMDYGPEATKKLLEMVEGKCLHVHIYDQDQYGRHVADIFCNGEYIQEQMLKKGCAWHYTTYNIELKLSKWEKEAREKRVGLWASRNPEEPWTWRKKHPRSN